MRGLRIKIFNKTTSGSVYETGKGCAETTPEPFFTHEVLT